MAGQVLWACERSQGALTRDACCGRRSRVVLTPRRRRQVRGGKVGPTGRRHALSANDGDKKARSPGRARNKPLKPLRAGMPGDSGATVVTTLVCYLHFAREAAGAAGTRHSPRPLLGERINVQLGRIVPRDGGLMDGAKWAPASDQIMPKNNLLLRRRADRRTAGRPVQVGDRYKRAEP